MNKRQAEAEERAALRNEAVEAIRQYLEAYGVDEGVATESAYEIVDEDLNEIIDSVRAQAERPVPRSMGC